MGVSDDYDNGSESEVNLLGGFVLFGVDWGFCRSEKVRMINESLVG